jgi:hypothetical protein
MWFMIPYFGVGHELRPESDQAARGNPELEADASAAVVDHLGHRAFAFAHLRDHDALVILGDVDDKLLDRLNGLPVHFFRHDVGPRHLELEAFAAHHLDQNRQLQLTTADHLHLLWRVGRLDANGHVADQLAVQPILELTGGDVLTLTAGHRRGVDAEDHRHGRLVDRHGRDGDLLLDVGNRLADGDVLNPRQADDVAGGRR